MGLITFFRNIKNLFLYDILDYEENISKTTHIANEINNLHYAIEHIPFEIEQDIKRISEINFVNDKIDVLKKLNSADYSISRFGDGELHLLIGKSIPCQEASEKLKNKLEEVLLCNNQKLMIGIPQIFVSYFDSNNIDMKKINRKTYGKLVPYLYKFLKKDKEYYAQDISFEYIQKGENANDEYYENYFSLFRSIWDKKDIVIVCGERVFDYLDYNIYDNASSIEYIFSKTNNAFEYYNELIEKICKYEKDKIIILMLGPTATVLAMDLCNLGYRALDLGHVAKDYNAYKKHVAVNKNNVISFFIKE